MTAVEAPARQHFGLAVREELADGYWPELVKSRQIGRRCVCCGAFSSEEDVRPIACGCLFCGRCRERGHADHAAECAVPCVVNALDDEADGHRP